MVVSKFVFFVYEQCVANRVMHGSDRRQRQMGIRDGCGVSACAFCVVERRARVTRGRLDILFSAIGVLCPAAFVVSSVSCEQECAYGCSGATTPLARACLQLPLNGTRRDETPNRPNKSRVAKIATLECMNCPVPSAMNA